MGERDVVRKERPKMGGVWSLSKALVWGVASGPMSNGKGN